MWSMYQTQTMLYDPSLTLRNTSFGEGVEVYSHTILHRALKNSPKCGSDDRRKNSHHHLPSQSVCREAMSGMAFTAEWPFGSSVFHGSALHTSGGHSSLASFLSCVDRKLVVGARWQNSETFVQRFWNASFCRASHTTGSIWMRRESSSLMVCRTEKDEMQMMTERDMRLIEEALPDFAELEKGALKTFLDIDLESSYYSEKTNHYEIMILVHEGSATEVQDVIQKIRDFIDDKKGKVWRLNDWGMRRLAYKIKHSKRANYVLMNLEIGSQAINQLNSLLEKDERIIRHLIITQKHCITQDSKPPPEYIPRGYDLDESELEEEDMEEDMEEEEEEDMQEDIEEHEVVLKG